MAVSKSVYQAPPGLEDLQRLGKPGADVEIEVEIEPANDEGDPTLGKPGEESLDNEFNANLAEELDENVLDSLGSELVAAFEEDVQSRKDWARMYVEGISLLGLQYEEKSEPWEGACGVYHPLLSEAVVRFQSETIMETFPAAGPVKTTIIGKETTEKKEAADRVKEDMNYQLTERMPEYRPEHERLLWALPIAGSSFKKVYYDPSLGRQVSTFVPPEDLVVPYGATTLESAERITHVMRKTPNELKKLQVAGFYLDIELGEPSKQLDDIEKAKAEESGVEASYDSRFRVLEMNVDLTDEQLGDDKSDDPIAHPYVVTIEKGTQKVLAVRRNWYEDDPLKLRRQHFVHYIYIPGFGFYGFGLMHLVGGYAKSATSILRQLVDAGTLANLPGGFKSNGLRVKGDDTPIAPGEFRDVDVASGTIKENILPLPYKEPSQTLFALLQNIVDEGRRFAAAADLKVSDMSANAPVGTTLAILERTLKVMTAVQARVHYAMKQEFKLLAGIIRDYTDDSYQYDVDGGDRQVKKSDYDHVDVIPVSDPNAATMSQRVVQYQAAMQMAEKSPQLYDQRLLHRQMLDVLGIKNAAKLVPMDEDMTPKDPVTENMDILMGKPAKAFLYQDHEAHIAVHMAAMQDPKIMQMLAMNPNAKAIQAAGLAHLNEHIAFAYRKEIEKYMGAAMPAMKDEEGEDATLPPQIEVQLSQLTAAAAAKLLQTHQAEAAAQQAQQQMQDPVIQMQMKELEQNDREISRKEKKDQQDFILGQAKLGIDVQKVEANKETQGAALGAAIHQTHAKLETQKEIEGMRMGLDVAKTHHGHSEARAAEDRANETEGHRMGVDLAKHHADRTDRANEAEAGRQEARRAQEFGAQQAEKQAAMKAAQKPKKSGEGK